MSDGLKPCPICGAEAVLSDDKDCAACTECAFPTTDYDGLLEVAQWQALPRRDESVAEVAREMREELDRSKYAVEVSIDSFRDWASRLESSGGKPQR
jgi:hypothetical protein